MSLLISSFESLNSVQAADSSVDRLARSLITLVSASSRCPVVNSWYREFLPFL